MARSFPYVRVNAFASTEAPGNPCVVILDADDLSPTDKLAIAKKINLSETAFVGKPNTSKNAFRLQFMTPVQEIPLAGHPTLAAVHALRDSGLISRDTQSIPLQLTAGDIEVQIDCSGEGALYAMHQLLPRFGKIYDKDQILPLFGLEPEDILPDRPLQTVDTGTPILMIPVCGLEALQKINVRLDAFASFTAQSDFFCVHLFCLQGSSFHGDITARDFAPPPDVIEDPFTGSATGAMGCYIAHYGLSEKRRLKVEQGHFIGQPGVGFVDIQKNNQQISSVVVGGGAVTVEKGHLIPSGTTWELQETGRPLTTPPVPSHWPKP